MWTQKGGLKRSFPTQNGCNFVDRQQSVWNGVPGVWFPRPIEMWNFWRYAPMGIHNFFMWFRVWGQKLYNWNRSVTYPHPTSKKTKTATSTMSVQVCTVPFLQTKFMPLQGSPAEKGQKRAGGRSRACPNFYCSLLVTGMCTLILWIIRLASQEQHATPIY